MLRNNKTLELIRRGSPAVGTWLQLHSVPATRLLVAQGAFRWMLVDFEHTPVDHTTASHLFSTVSDLSGGEITPVARVAAGTIDHIKHALDAGAQGVIVPMVNTAQEAEDAVRYARFPPRGERGGGGMHPHVGFGVNAPGYLAEANDEILVGVQIETAQGVANIKEILAVKGVDLVFIGPNDLHLSLGLPARFWSAEPAFLDAVRTVTEACREHGVPFGTLCRDSASVRDRIDDGFTFLGLASDLHFMLTRAGEEYGALHDLDEPASTWCNMVNLDRLPDALRGIPRA
ncbi:HpcH/HpaI aldolase/citrate lyase family protein [Streptomyces sp. NPDC050509]|uniref:HpcH/HpaI aldolase/citrate lyase family protein n=1 Tax=Streptomyces sp. NPDC050509 TaxID=3365620 RepID=UPI00379A3F7B